ncbi:MAG: VWA domain-containing protein [Planctomycetes bacterium]|nr:VWA domain-containing protein [Planctomycetota bacterium]MCD7897799.1 VWA domain-containing protein [Planctomycetaceae bacterium]
MFTAFFYFLRARGLKVTLGEWLTLVRALRDRVIGPSFTQFYYSLRTIVVKSEADFDRFDCAFLEFFKDIAAESDELPKELMDWLDNPDINPDDYPDLGRDDEFNHWSDDDIRAMFQKRLAEQKEEHNGGNYWIGTHGASPFGNNGESLRGIRVGGQSRKRLAMAVAGERRFRDFRGDNALNLRSFQTAFRKLRQFSSRVDAPKTELDLDETVRATGDNAGTLDLVFTKPRKNTVKLMLLMDSGGSMEPFMHLSTTLFQAVDRSNHFKDLRVYYFHNIFKKRMYTTPEIDYNDSIPTEWLFQNLHSDYKVIVVGDAQMAPRELTGGYYPGHELTPTGLTWLRRFRDHYKRLVWFTPSDNDPIAHTVWGASYSMIRKEVDIMPLTVDNLALAVKKLMVAR